MTAIKDLRTLLKNLSPELAEGEWVYVTVPGAEYGDLARLRPLATIMEDEGLSLLISREMAMQAGLGFDASLRRICLDVHSDLEAVGLTAAVSGLLAQHGIPANMVAGAFHDHVLVPADQADKALALLMELQSTA